MVRNGQRFCDRCFILLAPYEKQKNTKHGDFHDPGCVTTGRIATLLRDRAVDVRPLFQT